MKHSQRSERLTVSSSGRSEASRLSIAPTVDRIGSGLLLLKESIVKVVVIGTGYVGLVAAVGFADAGHQVLGVDRDEEKIRTLNQGRIPIYEPGLVDLFQRARPRLEFTSDLAKAMPGADVAFIAVGTPELEDGSADLGPTLAVVDAVARTQISPLVLVLKSTVPVGTAARVRERLQELGASAIEVVSNPEFLKEGVAVEDFMRPDRVVIGVQPGGRGEAVMRELYDPFLKNGNPLIVMDNVSAEMTKYAANAFLSVKISFINELALLADRWGADVNDVRRGFTSDRRINPAFFHPGVGFGGSCFPKDVKALVHSGRAVGVPMQVVDAADQVNDRQKLILYERVRDYFASQGKALRGLRIAMWGLAFKPQTDDVREAPALYLIEKLVDAGAEVVAYDPVARDTATKSFTRSFKTVDSAHDAVKDADALMIVTEWNEFRTPAWKELRASMRQAVIFDGRNVLDPLKATQAGFEYFCIGRQVRGSGSQTKLSALTQRTDSRKHKRCIVAGGAGFVGSHLVDRLLEEGHEVVAIDSLVTGRLSNLQAAFAKPRFRFIRADLRDGLDRLGLPEENGAFDEIYNLASPASPVDFARIPLHILSTSSEGHRHLLDFAAKTGAVCLYASSSEVYGDAEIHPQVESYFGNVNTTGHRSCYDEAKRYGEALSAAHAKENGTQVRMARIFNTYGPRMRPDDGRILPNFCMQGLQNQALSVYGDGSQTRSFCYVGDLVRGLITLMRSSESRPTNVGNPIELTVSQVAEAVLQITGSKAGVRRLPLPQNDPKQRRPDISRALSLGWRPEVNFESGLKLTLESFRQELISAGGVVQTPVLENT